MTWRAFFIGILGVVGLCLLVPVNDYRVGNTFLTGNHFPVGVFFFLFILTLLINPLLRLLRRRWILRQSELMLVWCMMIVASTVPASGLINHCKCWSFALQVQRSIVAPGFGLPPR